MDHFCFIEKSDGDVVFGKKRCENRNPEDGLPCGATRARRQRGDIAYEQASTAAKGACQSGFTR